MGRIQNAPPPAAGSRRPLLIGIALGAVLAASVACLLWVSSRDREPGAGNDSSSESSAEHAAALERLETAIAAESKARQALADRIAEINAKLALLGVAPGDLAGGASPEGETVSEDAEREGDIGDALETVADADLEASRFDEAALRSLGIHSSEIERLRERWVSQQLETTAISHQALREGWFHQERHRAELIRSELTLRSDLGDGDYDLYLYATGRPNRLRAGEVLAGSSASEAGLRPNDVIVSYDDTRIFAPGELLVASSSGESGESVALEIMREGRRRTLYIDRGPIGVILEHDRDAPLSD